MLRNVEIEAVANGWVVRVGCQRFVFDKLSMMLMEIGNYLTNPEQAEKAAFERFPNMKWTNNGPAVAQARQQVGETALPPLGEVLRGARDANEPVNRY